MILGATSNGREINSPPDWTLVRRGESFFGCAPDWAAGFSDLGYGLEGDGPRGQYDSPGRRPPATLDHECGLVLVRRYVHGGLLRAITGERFKDPGRLLDEVGLTLELARRGVAVPELVSLRALHQGPRSWQLEVGMRLVRGTRDLRAMLAERLRGELERSAWRKLLTSTGQAMGEAHRLGLDHVDLQPANLLVEPLDLKGPEPTKIWIIDLDRCRLLDRGMDQVAKKNLARLMRWILGRYPAGSLLSASDLARFMVAYESDSQRRKMLMRAVVQILEREGPWHRTGRAIERFLGLTREG